MKINNVLLLFLIASSYMNSFTQTRLVLSVALTNNHFEYRKKQYIQSIAICGKFGYENPYVIEALKKSGPTFLNDHSTHVYYAQSNNPNFRNNGINEAATLAEGISYFNFDSDDMIIKMTGRYYWTTDFFFRLVENNPDTDVFVKVNENGDVFTLAFAMRYKYMVEMYKNMDYNAMERHWINVEHEVGNYIKRKVKQGNFKVMYIKQLHIECDLNGSSTAPGTTGTVFH